MDDHFYNNSFNCIKKGEINMEVVYYKVLSICLLLTLGIGVVIIVSMYLDRKVMDAKLGYYINEALRLNRLNKK